LAVLPGDRGPATADLRLTVFDVGQGSAALVETPGGARLLVDAGGFAGSSFDVGERVVARALLTLGVRRLDAVAMSHEDFDHAGGVPSILDLFEGKELWISAPLHRRGRAARIEAEAVGEGRVLRILAAGDRWVLGGATVEILHPPRSADLATDNDLSL